THMDLRHWQAYPTKPCHAPHSAFRPISLHYWQVYQNMPWQACNPASLGSSLSTPLAGVSFSHRARTSLAGVSFNRRAHTRHRQVFHAAIGLSHAIGRCFMQPSGSHTPLAGVPCSRQAHTRHWQAFHAAVGLTHAIGRCFMQPSGCHTPLAGVYKLASAGISNLCLVRHSSSHLDACQVQPIFTRPGIGHPRIFSHNSESFQVEMEFKRKFNMEDSTPRLV
ncbi:hypothetical protein CHARACLAT_019683, partial [Characodon lateralis]|nr:hypothetical protein [Characodon lateralis]